MALNTLPFLAFVAAVAVVFFVTPPRYRWVVIVAASYYFYSTWETIPAIIGLVVLTVATYACALGMSRFPRYRKLLCGVGLVVSLGMLVVLKYMEALSAYLYGFLGERGADIAATAGGDLPWYLPVGFSFVSFTVASYLVDVYRGKMEPERHFGSLAAFIAFFPKILAGPIERAAHFLPQWRAQARFDLGRASEGIFLISWGLFKKVVVADRLALFADAAFATPAYATPVELIVGVYFYAFQIYCDFSGYTDIATGVFKILGFDLALNFRRPYLSRSIGEFWSGRWHVTLGTWFRDYLYIPLGGNRVGRLRLYLNLMIVFLVSGVWHSGAFGATVAWTFVAWGAINGLYQIASLIVAPVWKRVYQLAPKLEASPVLAFLQALGIFHLITFTWIFFRANTLGDVRVVLRRIYDGFERLPMLVRFYDYRDFDFVTSIVLIVAVLVFEIIDERRSIFERLQARSIAVRWAFYTVLWVALIVLGKWGTAVFIYMQF